MKTVCCEVLFRGAYAFDRRGKSLQYCKTESEEYLVKGGGALQEHTYYLFEILIWICGMCRSWPRFVNYKNRVVTDTSRTEKVICLAVSTSLKDYGIPERSRLFEVIQQAKKQMRKAVEGSPLPACGNLFQCRRTLKSSRTGNGIHYSSSTDGILHGIQHTCIPEICRSIWYSYLFSWWRYSSILSIIWPLAEWRHTILLT